MPTKIVSSARLTDTQLSSPPISAETMAARIIDTIMGSPTWSDRIAEPNPPTPASAPTQRNSWPVLPKMMLKATA